MSDATTSFRPDIDGLRAVSVLAVILYHLGLPALGGGFLGVDAFFVISGFLIIRLLAKEISETGGVALPKFWARRARRLLPASATVIVVSSLVGFFVLPVRIVSTSEQAASATLYASNFWFLLSNKDYFEATAPLLLQHTWSLSVEEQFYVAVPLLLAAAALVVRIARVSRARANVVVAAVIAVLFVVSLAACIFPEKWHASGTLLFYSPLTRAWEFCLGGLVALARPERLPAVVGSICAAVGAALIVAGFAVIEWLGIDVGIPFPGALLTTVGAALVIANHNGASWVARALAWQPMQWIGRLSYSLYLVHWPVLMLLDYGVGPKPAPLVPLLGFALSFVAAAALHYTIEKPLRFHRKLTASTLNTFMATLLLMLLSLGVTAALYSQRASDPKVMRLLKFGKQVNKALNKCGTARVPALERKCAFGKKTAKNDTILLIGDSHAMQWVAALSDVGSAENVRILYSGTSGCPALNLRVRRDDPGECERWRAQLPKLFETLKPDAVLVANAARYLSTGEVLEKGDPLVAWRRGLLDIVRMADAAKVPIGVVLDVPALPQNALDCLALHRPDACAPLPAQMETLAKVHAIEREVFTGRAVFDPLAGGILCQRSAGAGAGAGADATAPLRCPPATKNGKLFYRDSHHLTISGAQRFVPPLQEFVRGLLREPRASAGAARDALAPRAKSRAKATTKPSATPPEKSPR